VDKIASQDYQQQQQDRSKVCGCATWHQADASTSALPVNNTSWLNVSYAAYQYMIWVYMLVIIRL
jgi:hypothetical protein